MTEQTKSQIDRFKDAARQLGCDENEAAFDEKLRKIAGKKLPGAEANKPPVEDF